MGFHKEAWALFNSIEIQAKSPQIWTAAFIGLRMEQWTDDRLLRFVSQDNVFDVDNTAKESFLLMAHLIDRDSVGSFTKIINDMKWKVDPKWQTVLEANKNQLIDFADGYIAVKKDEFNKAYEIFRRQNYFKNNWYLNECLLPYIVWAGVKSGKLAEFDKNLEFNAENNDGFDVHLSYALLLGHKGNHLDAIKHLQLSSYRIPSTNLRPFMGWYQLVEVCEMLHKDTGYKGYKDLALKWAKLHQRILPMYAWAYAIEAKYTESSPDRLRALALTLHLDKQSERISNFSDSEKAKAIKWMEKNNPFISKQDKSMVEM
jgi:tetratricopeptide (TPR) repeat protein